MGQNRQMAMAQVAALLDEVDIFQLSSTLRLEQLPSTPYIRLQVVFREYLRFLTIKIVCTENPAMDFSPSHYIEQLWRSHILDTTSYHALQDKYPTRLEYDPMPPEGLHTQRLKNTLAKYVELFDEDPLCEQTRHIWAEKPIQETRQKVPSISHTNAKKAIEDSQSISIYLK